LKEKWHSSKGRTVSKGEKSKIDYVCLLISKYDALNLTEILFLGVKNHVKQ